MSKQSNPAFIGAFVIGAIALLAISVVIFGGSELLKEKRQYVTYFERSVKGLRVGSSVLLKGVRIGYVTNIQLYSDVDSLNFIIPVTFQVVPEAITLFQGDLELGSAANAGGTMDLKRLIDAGLRAQLNSESFVTGQLLIELDLVPDSPAIFRGHSKDLDEIPSIPSDIQQAIENFRDFISDVQQSVDVPAVMAKIDSTIAGLERIVNSPELAESLTGINQLINSDDTQQLTTDLRIAVNDFRSTLDDTRQLVNSADSEIQGIAGKLSPAIETLGSTLAQGEKILTDLGAQIGDESEINYELVRTMNEVQGASRSLRILLDYLERHPEALLKGKPD